MQRLITGKQADDECWVFHPKWDIYLYNPHPRLREHSERRCKQHMFAPLWVLVHPFCLVACLWCWLTEQLWSGKDGDHHVVLGSRLLCSFNQPEPLLRARHCLETCSIEQIRHVPAFDQPSFLPGPCLWIRPLMDQKYVKKFHLYQTYTDILVIIILYTL